MFVWTQARIETLKAHWSAGRTARQIADEIGTTRNAVIGKAHRLGLRWVPSKPKPRPRPRRKPVKTKPKNRWRNGHLVAAKPEPPPPVPGVKPPRPLFELAANECRWIVDDNNVLFCGGVVEKQPYCPQHMRIARQGRS